MSLRRRSSDRQVVLINIELRSSSTSDVWVSVYAEHQQVGLEGASLLTNDCHSTERRCGEQGRKVLGITDDLRVIIGYDGCRDDICTVYASVDA